MKRIAQLLGLIALAWLFSLAAFPASSAHADDPTWLAGIPWPTTVPWPTANPLTIGVPWSPSLQTYPLYAATPLPPIPQPLDVPAPTPLPPAVLSSTFSAPALITYAAGATRNNALEPDGVYRTLNAGASVWYRVGSGGVHMDVWLDANPVGGVSMAIYAPNGSDKPVGYGTPDKSNADRLLWSGGHWQGEGNWYARIANNNPLPVQYRIQSNARDISNKSCYSYWEYIGSNLVYWTRCD